MRILRTTERYEAGWREQNFIPHEEAQSYLAYALICETMEGAFWNSGRRRRLYSKTFTEAEQRQIPRIKATAHKWCLVTGVPEKVRMRYSTYLLWQKLAMFCAEI